MKKLELYLVYLGNKIGECWEVNSITLMPINVKYVNYFTYTKEFVKQYKDILLFDEYIDMWKKRYHKHS